jgi:hypothetical protein
VTVPENLSQALCFVILVVPGITFISVRDAFAGPRTRDQSTSARLLESLFLSVNFDATYLVLFAIFIRIPPPQLPAKMASHPATAGVCVLIFFLVVPAVAAARDCCRFG